MTIGTFAWTAVVGLQPAIHPEMFHRVMDTVMASDWQILPEAVSGLSVLLSGGPFAPFSVCRLQL
jgi:hypothetical protein